MSSVFRRISPSERLYLAARDLQPHFLIQMVVQGVGALDPKLLQDAVDRASRVNPGARLVRSGEDWLAVSATPRVRVIANGVLDYDHLSDDAVLNGPIARPDYLSEPLNCEVLLLTSETPTLIFRAFHGSMDAKGLQLWIADVFRALRGEQPVGAADPVSELEFAQRLGIPGKATVMRLSYRTPVGRGAPVPGRPYLLRHRTVPAVTSAVVARIGEIITTAVDAPTRLMFPVDLRRHDAAVHSTANLTLPLHVDAAPGENWQQINGRLLAGLLRGDELNQINDLVLAKSPAAIQRAVLRFIGAVGKRTDRNLYSAVLSHTGKIDLAEYTAPGFTPTAVAVIPVHLPIAPLSFAIVEAGGATAITVSCRNGEGVAERLEQLLDRIVDAIEAAGIETVQGEEAGVAERREVVAASASLTGSDPHAVSGSESVAETAALQELEPSGPELPAATSSRSGGPAVAVETETAAVQVAEDGAETETAAVPVTEDDGVVGEPIPGPGQLPGHPVTLVELLRGQAALRPESVALTGPDGTLTYAQLRDRAAGIAQALRDNGIRGGDTVAVVAGRTLAGQSGQWGILAAGAAFLPLDPRHPRERIGQILRDSGVRLCLVERELAELVGETVPTLVLEDLPERSGDLDVEVAAADIAYVIYTSGSTGRPKGVQVTHDNVMNFLRAAVDWYLLTPETRYGHYHTPAADLACMAMVTPMIAGGAVVLVPGEINHLSLTELLAEDGANTVFLTPSLAEVIVRQGIPAVGMRAVALGGEQVSRDLARRARKYFGPQVRLLNSYGPAEVTMVCVSQVLADSTPAGATSAPIGFPAPGTTVHLLDEAGQRVADGENGELYVGGPQVAAGYLDRPELTAERFVTLDGERVYRTGDLVRRLPGGALEFVGRVDHQVKIRGNRVEPDEVRCVLEAHPEIAAAAVLGRRREDQGDHVLEAYIVPAASATAGQPGDRILRDYLADALPVYMIPAAFHRIAELPLTDNGKIDRVALAESGDPRAAEPETTPDAPSTTDEDGTGGDVKDRVAEIWGRVLHCDPAILVADSDFFALGGDSLATMEMLAQVSREIVGKQAEQAFVAQLEGLLQRLTLDRVCEAVTVALAGAR
ncbi:amino acid adenylation domain-containing protein [Nocardia yamanashiensis]|uniref:non-ribosomal peptide synthetase n=1 Tax=Nocardia yamanashiensis TaxID=209247 RepID=UPI001E441DB5|nr:non-ribosomal peptide synthetase [Nocardia yamanashiensis]UGT42900.1 amino acid adenylation domain-containing protein [Nocardia yamanashiensis]